MSERLVEGIWDCPYCEATAIGGLKKYCPNCGHPQDKGTKFRMGTEIRYLTGEETEKVGREPDWACEYCASLNNAKFKYCSNCGAPRDKENKDYFQLRDEERKVKKVVKQSEKVEETVKEKVEESVERQVEETVKPRLPINSKILKYVLMVMAAIIAVSTSVMLLINLLTPREYYGTITDKTWERKINIEEYCTLSENDWTLPLDGRLQYTTEEIHHYEKVFDHYETKTKEVSEQVFDGYDVAYSDNGNGTFTEHSTPRYRTEYRTETYQEPVYRDEPVYRTMYYYEIDRWVHSRSVKTAGRSDDPYWGEPNLSNPGKTEIGSERESGRKEKYSMKISVAKKNDKIKVYKYSLPQSEWEQYSDGQEVTIVVKLGRVKEVKVKE